MLEEQCGPASAQRAITKRRHLETRVDDVADAAKLARAFELREEIAKVGVSHRRGSRRRTTP
jgi:hypothetical protein